jgi:type VII secretion protein EssA
MKELVKPFSVLAVLIGVFTLCSSQPLAETTLDHSGKIRLQTERIGEDAAEREKLENQDYKETELEKKAPYLFKEQTRAAIKTKVLEMEQTTGEVEKGLFVTPSEPNTALKDAEKGLFASGYTVQHTAASDQNNNEKNQDGFMNSKTLTAFLGFVVVGCGGIYTMMRKMLE